MRAIGIQNSLSILSTGNGLLYNNETLLILQKYLNLEKDYHELEGSIVESIFCEMKAILDKLIHVENLEMSFDKNNSIRYVNYDLKIENRTVCIDRLNGNHKKIMNIDSILAIINDARKNPNFFYYYFLSQEVHEKVQEICMEYKEKKFLTVKELSKDCLFALKRNNLVHVINEIIFPSHKMEVLYL